MREIDDVEGRRKEEKRGKKRERERERERERDEEVMIKDVRGEKIDDGEAKTAEWNTEITKWKNNTKINKKWKAINYQDE